MNHPAPSESSCRTIAMGLAEKENLKTIEYISGEYFFLVGDENGINAEMYSLVLDGKISNPSITKVIDV